jgi:hypothetical protein
MPIPRASTIALLACLIALNGQPPRAAAEEPVGILLAAGDIATCPADPRAAHAKTAALLGREIEAAQKARIPVAVLALGDLAYEKGERKEFVCFGKTWGAYNAYILPVPGNHEFDYDPKPYFAYFEDKLLKLEKKEKGQALTGYYSLIFPDDMHPNDKRESAWRLIALNSPLLTDPQKGWPSPAEQHRWLEGVLKDNKARCVLAFSHHFLHSSGRHGHGAHSKPAPKDQEPVAEAKMRPAYKLLHAYGASLFLAAHDHHYEQLAKVDAYGKRDEQGIRSFIAGTGGKYPYPDKYDRKWDQFSEEIVLKTHGILRLRLYPTRFEWDFVKVSPMGEEVALRIRKDDCNAARTPKP